jgi:hypothetical protein
VDGAASFLVEESAPPPADMKRWRKEGRVDILDLFGAGDRWTTAAQCPYLVKVRGHPEFVCGIQETKPSDCRRWDSCNPEIAKKFQNLIKGQTRKQLIQTADSLCDEYETAEE